MLYYLTLLDLGLSWAVPRGWLLLRGLLRARGRRPAGEGLGLLERLDLMEDGRE